MNEELIDEHIKDFNECTLKKDIQEGLDYKFYSYTVMKVFEKYQGTRIPRRAYFSGV